jgi:hypothetical protein
MRGDQDFRFLRHLPPERIVERILQREKRIAEIRGEIIKALLEKSS